jgi:hypothetical protein
MISKKKKIVRKIPYTPNIFGMEFRFSGIHPLPGQFFQVQVDEGVDPFLNRPISVASYKGSRLLMIVKIVGRGTRMLSLKNAGGSVLLVRRSGSERKGLYWSPGALESHPSTFSPSICRAAKPRLTCSMEYGTVQNSFSEKKWQEWLTGRSVLPSTG